MWQCDQEVVQNRQKEARQFYVLHQRGIKESVTTVAMTLSWQVPTRQKQGAN